MVVIWWLCISSSGETRKFDFLGQIWPWRSRSIATKKTGILAELFCTSGPNSVIIAAMDNELWCGQAHNGVNSDLKFNLTLQVKVNYPEKQ